MNLKNIIEDFNKYHYFAYINNKVGKLSSDNSNTEAKNLAFSKLNKLNQDKIFVYRIKLSKTSSLESSLINLDKTGPLYFEIREYIFKKNKKIYPNTDNAEANVFLKKKYLVSGLKMKDFVSNVKKFIKGKLSLIPSKINYIKN